MGKRRLRARARRAKGKRQKAKGIKRESVELQIIIGQLDISQLSNYLFFCTIIDSRFYSKSYGFRAFDCTMQSTN